MSTNTNVRPNLIKPRWSKVISDLFGDKTRTILVVASIAAGVFAVGAIITAFVILQEDINLSYASANPVNIEVRSAPFREDFLRLIEKVPGVDDVEGRRSIGIRARKEAANWQGMALVGVEDFEQTQINQLGLIEGTLTPSRGQVLISDDFINNTGFLLGDEILIELPDGSAHTLVVVGLVSDQTSARPDANNTSKAFVTLDTMRAMGMGNYFDQLYVTVEGDGSDEEFIAAISDDVEDKMVGNQQPVFRIEESLSNKHPMSDTILAMMGVLVVLGVLITILSASLIINTLNALLTQQRRQIGVMKLVGGRSPQILGMYLVLIVSYSLIALALAVPLGAVAGYALAQFVTELMGAQLQPFRVIPIAIAIQVVIAFLIPLGAGFFPVNKGARTNVRRAISDYRPGSQSSRPSLFNRGGRWMSWISRPVLLSFRNTFRKKGRLFLTIFTLTVAGAVFIAVFNVSASMDNMMARLMDHFLGDVTVNFTQPYRTSKVERELLSVPGVEVVEGWGGAQGDILDENDEVVSGLLVIAPPADTALFDPELSAGRWLLPGEKKAMVVSDTIFSFYPDLVPGDKLTVELTGSREEQWEVVGIFPFVSMLGDPMAYASYDYISDQIDLPNQAFSFRLTTETSDDSSLDALIARIDNQLEDRGYAVQFLLAGSTMRENASTGINTLVIFLLIMAILTAFVGSIGLTGTMSINVLERTREIGVMRTIGAVDIVIMQSVIIEGLLIGLITWVLAIFLSYPISLGLLTIIGQAMTGSVIALVLTPMGPLVWLGVVIVLSIIASIMPARNAAKLTINEVLAYE